MRTSHLHLEPSNIEPAQCDRCHTADAATFDVVIVDDDGVSTIGHGHHCTHCDNED